MIYFVTTDENTTSGISKMADTSVRVVEELQPSPKGGGSPANFGDQMAAVTGLSKMSVPATPITTVALLKREAHSVLSLIKKKPIIAIDLDYTVQSAHVFRGN
jgi:hypothetical protein